jgi:uncharacterized protein YbjT (DUF2867 family)
MKIIVIGGTGLIGSRVVSNLNARGHEAISASPRSGVNTVTGEGLADALRGAQVVVDVSNSPSWEDQAVLEFFQKSTQNILAAAKAAGVGYYVALSVVGADRLPDSGYMRAKVAQENLMKAGSVPYTILRATQFMEFLGGIADASGGDEIKLTTALLQPIAADDVAAAVTDVALEPPANATLDIAGPVAYPMAEIVGAYLQAKGDKRRIVADDQTGYFGAALAKRALVPAGEARIGATSFDQWLKRQGLLAAAN